jgi:hypothetical protein
MILKMSGP